MSDKQDEVRQRHLRVGCLCLLVASSIAAAEHTVAVSFEFPERPPVQVAVSLSEAVQLTGVKYPYKIEFWVRGALAKADLKYSVDLKGGRRSVTAIDDVRNDSTGTWVYFVNGVRSRYHINTQTEPRVRFIRFVYERAGAESVTLSGRYVYRTDVESLNIIGDAVCFFPDSESSARVPRPRLTNRTVWFCFTATPQARSEFSIPGGPSACGYTGTGKVMVSNYQPYLGEGDGHDVADLVRVVSFEPPGKLSCGSAG